MEVNKIYKGLALDVIKTFPDQSINSVITSPPYWQLRDYGFSEQWGLEPTFEEYLEHLWSLMDEIWRVLKDDGTVWINLGDSYSSNHSGGSRGPNATIDSKTGAAQEIKQSKKTNEGSKCLLLIPHRFAIGCIERGWIMRNDIVWAKRNAMPESVTDRFSKKHEYFFFMTKSTKYYFDLDGIRENYVDNYSKRLRNKGAENWAEKTKGPSEGVRDWWGKGGKNPGDVSDFWDIPTKPSSKEHYAAFNEKLIEKPIIAGCPKDGIILDPFCGTGTTLMRVYELDRKVIGIEGSEEHFKDADKELRSKLAQTKLF